MGFDTLGQERASTVEEWEPGKLRTFHYFDHTAQKKVVLFTARAYQNGNIHRKINQGFIARLNVEFGRLRGWINTPEQAAEEIDGVDIDLEQTSPSCQGNPGSAGCVAVMEGWHNFVVRLRQLMDADTRKEYYITAVPINTKYADPTVSFNNYGSYTHGFRRSNLFLYP